MIRGMIFDLDGVLVDTAGYHYRAWARLAREWFGYDLTPAQNQLFKGVNRAACMKILCELAGASLTEAEFERGMDLKNRWYVERVGQMTPEDALPGGRAYVERMRARGMRLAVGTASRNCALALARTGLAGLFDAVVDGNAVTRAKPHPEVFLTAANALGIPPGECVVFEDAQAGIDAARAGGMRCCAIGRRTDLTGYDWIYPGLYAIQNDEEMT